MLRQVPDPSDIVEGVKPRRAHRGSADFQATIEKALAGERASALGRAGRNLEEAIDIHRLLTEVGSASPEQIDKALSAVAYAAWSLIVQRECIGFRKNNLEYIRKHYQIPAAALRRI